MLKGYVQIGQDFSFGHQRYYFVYVGVGVDIVQANPYAQLRERLA